MKGNRGFFRSKSALLTSYSFCMCSPSFLQVAEAEKYRREDDERTKKVEAINDLETLISEARQIVGDLKDARKGIYTSADRGAESRG